MTRTGRTTNRAARLQLRATLDLADHAVELLHSKEEAMRRERARLEGHADRTERQWRERCSDATDLAPPSPRARSQQRTRRHARSTRPTSRDHDRLAGGHGCRLPRRCRLHTRSTPRADHHRRPRSRPEPPSKRPSWPAPNTPLPPKPCTASRPNCPTPADAAEPSNNVSDRGLNPNSTNWISTSTNETATPPCEPSSPSGAKAVAHDEPNPRRSQ